MGLIVIALALVSIFSFAGNNDKVNNKTLLTPASFDQMKACIDACNNCAAMCNNCSSKCLKEKDVAAMARCIQLCMECASI